MNLIALLSWYDEDPAWLTRCITSLNKLPVTHLIAVDGAYALYPDARRESGPLQAFAIADAAKAIGAKYRIHIPRRLWEGNEVEKRNHMFELAETVASPEDWYFVIDADEHITEAPDDVPAQLAETPFDVGTVKLVEPGHPLGTMVFPTHPKFFRAIPGLRTHLNHFTYKTPDGRCLWGNARTERLEARHVFDMTVMHNTKLRHPDRYQAALTYYDTRDQAGIEEIPENRPLAA